MSRTPPVTAWTRVPRQDGRIVVVTGASSGIGMAAARALCAAGAHVVLAVRDEAKGRAAAAGMHPTGEGAVQVSRCDVSDLGSVHAFAEALLAEHGGLDVLVANAGVMAVPFARSVDDVELQLATNHLGHFALTNLLLPQLRDRVVVVSSTAHRRGRIDVDDLDWARRGYRPFAAYAQSKLANLLFVSELQRRLDDAGSALRALAAHPGNTHTAITGATGSALKTRVGSFGHALVGMPAWRGALPTLYAATEDLPGDTFVGPHRLWEMHGWPTPVGRSTAARDRETAQRLWAWSEEAAGVRFPLG